MCKNAFLWQFIALSAYTVYMGVSFCDGFKLHVLRKLAWYLVFLCVCIISLKLKGEFNLTFILPLPSLLAVVFGRIQIKEEGKVKK